MGSIKEDWQVVDDMAYIQEQSDPMPHYLRQNITRTSAHLGACRDAMEALLLNQYQNPSMDMVVIPEAPTQNLIATMSALCETLAAFAQHTPDNPHSSLSQHYNGYPPIPYEELLRLDPDMFFEISEHLRVSYVDMHDNIKARIAQRNGMKIHDVTEPMMWQFRAILFTQGGIFQRLVEIATFLQSVLVRFQG